MTWMLYTFQISPDIFKRTLGLVAFLLPLILLGALSIGFHSAQANVATTFTVSS